MSRKALFTHELIEPLLHTAREAGAVIMPYYRSAHDIHHKEDASPVTEADRKADRLIVAALARLTPDFPIVSEEGEKPDVGQVRHFWLVDPLDGTRGFIRGKGYFTVNIGLIENGMPVLGVIYDPANDMMYWGDGNGAFCMQADAIRPLHARARTQENATALISHSAVNAATEAYLTARRITERIPCASSIKFCLLADGKADVYPRFGPTMEWDTAAGHAILAAAGGKVTTPDGAPFLYGKKRFLNGPFIASA